MKLSKLVSHILLCVTVCPVFVITYDEDGALGGHYAIANQEHIHASEPPCAVCPRNGICVPKVQCPAHIRPGTYNPRCHIDKQHIGVCCFTGSSHAAESDHKLRSSLNLEDVNAVHNISRLKLDNWIKKARLLERDVTIAREKEPSYGYHSLASHKEIDDLGRGGLLNLFAAQELQARQFISDDDLALGLTGNTEGLFCPMPPTCPAAASRYRRIDGNCNNIEHPSWGGAHTGYERLLPPDYRDGTWAFRLSVTGSPLPSARDVSDALLVDGNNPSRSHNLMFMQFGHFLVHDMSAGVLFSTGE